MTYTEGLDLLETHIEAMLAPLIAPWGANEEGFTYAVSVLKGRAFGGT